MTPVVTPAEIEAFRVKLNVALRAAWKARSNFGTAPNITAVIGNKYAKLVREDSVYGFIDLTTGDLLKAASWAKPAKHARGNIFDKDPLAGCGIYGLAYLRN
jgi:hypothetical protein